jgi:polyisoprenoid-binding protein YceI
MRLNQSRAFVGFLTRGVLLLSLLLVLTLVACGSSDEVGEAVPTNPPAPIATEAPTPTPEPTEAAPEPTPTAEAAADATPEETEASETAPAEGSSELRAFKIDPAQSEARFIVDEVLFGNPNTVTGRTTEVSGEIQVNLSDPTQTTVSEIQINARSLATDNRFRNRSINRLILQSNRDEYQFITFTPTAIEGLPSAAAAGDTFAFQITGDLKIREIVQPTTFDVSVTADSDTQITGLAQTVVTRAAFELTIPNVEGVADVTDEVRLELEFVATASE